MPDGVAAFVTDTDGRVRPYDLDTGQRGAPLPALGATADPSSALSASPDGRFLAQVARTSVGADTVTSTIGIFDVTTAALVTGPIEVDGPLAAHAVFGAGDRTLFVAREPDPAVLQYDTATGVELGELAALPAEPTRPVRAGPRARRLGTGRRPPGRRLAPG